jgi:hypothetical protein
MSAWMQVVLTLCAVATTVALVSLLLAARRSVLRAALLLATVEREINPTVARLQTLTDELGGLIRQAHLELGRVGTLTERAIEVSEGIGRVLQAVGGFARAGQIVGVATAVKRGIEVFLKRMRS